MDWARCLLGGDGKEKLNTENTEKRGDAGQMRRMTVMTERSASLGF
jgi:hypothetical protein